MRSWWQAARMWLRQLFRTWISVIREMGSQISWVNMTLPWTPSSNILTAFILQLIRFLGSSNRLAISLFIQVLQAEFQSSGKYGLIVITYYLYFFRKIIKLKYSNGEWSNRPKKYCFFLIYSVNFVAYWAFSAAAYIVLKFT